MGVFLIRELSIEFGEKNPYNICLTSVEKYSSESKRMTRNQIKIRISSDDNKVKVKVKVKVNVDMQYYLLFREDILHLQ